MRDKAWQKAYNAAYRIANREKLLEYDRIRRTTTKRKRQFKATLEKHGKKYFLRYRERRNANTRMYFQSLSKEKKREYALRYYKRNRFIVYLRNKKRRDAKRSAKGHYSPYQVLQRFALFGWKCRYCGTQLVRGTATIDHMIPISRGGSNWPSNIVPACDPCNKRKNRKTFFEFTEKLKT